MRNIGYGLGMLLALLLLLVSACTAQPEITSTTGNTSDTSSDTPTTQPSPAPAEMVSEAEGEQVGAEEETRQDTDAAQTLVFAGDFGSIRSLDPAEAYELDSSLVVGNLYETLVSYNPETMQLEGVLAQDWRIEEGDESWVLEFALHPQATFASGNAVTADDVVFSWQRAIDLDGQPAFLFTDIAQLPRDQIRAVDNHTVEVVLPSTANPQVFLSILSFNVAAVLEREAVEQQGELEDTTWLNAQSVGSGPYMLERWDRDERVVLRANPSYWRETVAPSIEQVVMRDIADQTDLRALITAGEVDLVQNLTTVQADALQDVAGVEVQRVETLYLIYMGMNVTDPLLGQPDVREAIRYALNYAEIATLLHDNALMTQEIIPAGIPGHSGQRPFTYDPERAKRLLEQAGITDEVTIELLVPTGSAPGGIEWSTLAAKIQYDLEQVGIILDVQQTDQLLDTYRAQQHQIVMTLWSPDFPDPDANVTPFADASAESVAWRNQWDDAAIAELVQQAAREQNTTRRMKLYQQISERVLHEGPYVVLYQPSRLFAHRSTLHGFTYAAADTPAISFNLLRKDE